MPDRQRFGLAAKAAADRQTSTLFWPIIARLRLSLAFLWLAMSVAGARACDGPAYHAFDFWLGTWRDASSPSGDIYRVGRILGGCGIEESLHDGRDGNRIGSGLAGYDRAAGVWRQLWVGGDGQVIEYAGGLQADGTVALQTRPDTNGEIRRFAYRDIAADSVRTEYLASADGGLSWRLFWEGRYVRIAD